MLVFRKVDAHSKVNLPNYSVLIVSGASVFLVSSYKGESMCPWRKCFETHLDVTSIPYRVMQSTNSPKPPGIHA